MVYNPVLEICERVAEVQALLDDHVAGGKQIGTRGSPILDRHPPVVLRHPRGRHQGYFAPKTPPCSGLFAITDHDIVSA